ncbi:hypothetical protein [Endozoicomonas numazuensis]|uniref:Uncharacterized protein n=1 Tax=Endozoicomonas numazuensis TaxID=1137799 RepID=A0A081ND37_9GAMM|nr:hypothetical protein [Endozoicomonas numazuensis]KEQ16360.1 hypothetical protein GZ78_20990 [Endozoicomonas numazuensis]
MDSLFPGSQEGSPFASLNTEESPLTSLQSMSLGDEVVFTPRKEGTFKGYSVWVHEGTKSQPFIENEVLIENRRPIPERSLSERVVIAEKCDDRSWYTHYFFGTFISWLTEPREYKTYLNEVDDYRAACKKDNISISEKLRMLSSLSRHCKSVVFSLESKQRGWMTFTDLDQTRLDTFREELKKLKDETWYIMGLEAPEKGTIYTTEDEFFSRENYASGQSATVAKVKYKNGFEAVFKPTSHQHTVESAAADRFGLLETQGDIKPIITEPNSGFEERQWQDLKTSKEVAAFHALDGVLGTNVTPRTRWTPGEETDVLTEELAVDSYNMFEQESEYVSDDAQARLRPKLLEIYNNERAGHELELQVSHEFPVEQAPSKEEQARLHIEGELVPLRKEDGSQVLIAWSNRFPDGYTPTQEELEKMHLHGMLHIRKLVPRIVPMSPSSRTMQASMSNLQLLDFLMATSTLQPRTFKFYEAEDGDGLPDWRPEASNAKQQFFKANFATSIPKRIDRETADRILATPAEAITQIAITHQLTDQQAAFMRERFEHLKIIIDATVNGREIPEDSGQHIKGKLYIIDDWDQDTLNDSAMEKGSYMNEYVLKPRMEAQPFEPLSAAQAKLANRAVLFCELDSLMGIHLTPPTWYSEHMGENGYCQEFVQDAKELVTEKPVPLPTERQADYRDQVPDIVRGVNKINGYVVDPQHIPDDIQTLSDQELLQLHTAGHLKVTQSRTVDILPLESAAPELQKCMANSQLLDFITGSVDRNPGNFLYVKEIRQNGSTVWVPRMIDNDLSFLARLVSSNPVEMSIQDINSQHASIGFPAQVDLETAQHIVKIDPKELILLAQVHQLHITEIAALVDRFRALKETLEYLLEVRESLKGLVADGNPPGVNEALHACLLGKDTEDDREKVSDMLEDLDHFPGRLNLEAFLQGDKVPFDCRKYLKGNIRLVEQWDLRTYQHSIQDSNSYVRRHILERRIEELPNLKDTNPELMAKTLNELMPTLGPRSLARALVRYRPGEVSDMMEVYSQKYGVKTFAAANQLTAFVNEYFEQRMQLERARFERNDVPVELIPGPRLEADKALLIHKMLGKDCSAQSIGHAIYWTQVNGLKSYEVFHSLMTQLQSRLQKEKPHQHKQPSYEFKQAFPELCGPDVPKSRRALLEFCFSTFSDKTAPEVPIVMMRFWDRMQQTIEVDPGASWAITNSPEFIEALDTLTTTPDLLNTLTNRLQDQDMATCNNVLRGQLLPQRAPGAPARDPEKEQETLTLLAKCFNSELL